MIIPDALLRHLANCLPWHAGTIAEKRLEIVRVLLEGLEMAGMAVLAMADIELNGPAMIVTGIRQAREAWENGDEDSFIDALHDAEYAAQKTLEWLRANAEIGVRIPIAWTDFVTEHKS